MTKMRIVEDAETPTGQPGFLVECTCGGHAQGKNRAILRAETRPGVEKKPALIHGHVNLANHPALSRAPQIVRNGPWKA